MRSLEGELVTGGGIEAGPSVRALRQGGLVRPEDVSSFLSAGNLVSATGGRIISLTYMRDVRHGLQFSGIRAVLSRQIEHDLPSPTDIQDGSGGVQEPPRWIPSLAPLIWLGS